MEAPPFPVNLGSGNKALPAMRATSTGNNVTFHMLPAANSCKSVDEMVGLGDGNRTFRCLTVSTFTSRIDGVEIMEGDGLLFTMNTIRVLILAMLLLSVGKC